jgi:hypothetical protein
MPRLDTCDVKEILDMLEDGINVVPKLNKIEKMKMRSKIRKQGTWLLELRNPTAEMIFQTLEWRLSDVFSLYPYGFSDRLRELLREKSAHQRSM